MVLSTRLFGHCGCHVWRARTLFLSLPSLKLISPVCSASVVWSLGTSVSRLHRTRRLSGPVPWTTLVAHWLSTVCPPWSSSPEFIGHVFDLCGHSNKSADNRQHMANCVLRRWAPLLMNVLLPVHERMEAFRVSVASSALWFASCRTLTKTQSSKLGSLSARQLCRIVSCRWRPDETSVEQ